MSVTRVTQSPISGGYVDLKPCSSPLSMNERPSSRQKSKTQGLLSPKLGQTSLDLALLRNGEDGVQSRERSFRRSKSEPYMLPEKFSLPEHISPGRNSSLCSNQGIEDLAKLRRDRQLIGLVKTENHIRDLVRRKYSDFRMAFQLLDDDKIGSVSTKDFRDVMNTFGVSLSNDQLYHLLLKIGADGNSMVNYVSFLEAFRVGPVLMPGNYPSMLAPPRSSDSLEGLEAELRRKLTPHFVSFMNSLRLFDYNRDGNVHRRDLKRILESFGIKLQENQLNKMLQRYAINRGLQCINYVDFLRSLGISLKSSHSRPKPSSAEHLFLDRPSNSKTSSQMTDDYFQGLTLGQIEKRLREKIMLKYPDLQRAFIAFDKNRDGYVGLSELKRVLTHFLFPMSDQMFNQLMERCGIQASHKIPYDHFLDKFRHPVEDGFGQTIPIRPSHKVNPIRETMLPVEMKELWERLHNHIVNNYSSAKKAFLAFDDDKDGRVRRKEFRKVLETFPFKLSEEEFNKLMYRVDPDGKGYISYHEFLDAFEAKEGEGAHPWLYGVRKLNTTKQSMTMSRQRAQKILRDKIMDNWKTIWKAFIKSDENSDGFISRTELKILLYRYHIPITDEHFQDLWNQCDENKDGKIQYDEFLKSLGVDISSTDVKGFSTRITDESEEKIQLMKTDQLSRQHVASKNALSRTTGMTADEVISLLKNHIIQRSADVRKTFLKYDYDGDGKLSKKEFRMTLQNLGLLMQNDQYKELTNRLGFYQGTMSYSDFIHKFEEIEKFGEGGKTLHMDNHRYNKVKERSESMTAEEVEEIMQKKIVESFQTLRQAFYAVDSNHDGQITRAELRRLLDFFMIPINDIEFDRLMTEKMKMPKNRTITYRDFVQRFQQNENFQKGHPWLFSHQHLNTTFGLKNLTAEEAFACLQQKANDQWRDVSAAFLAFDKDGNSVVSRDELRGILNRFNIAVGKDEFKKLWDMFEVDKRGHIDHSGFLRRLGVELVPGDMEGISNKITKGSESEIYRHHQNQQLKQHRAALNQANTTSFMSAVDVENKLRDKFRDNYQSFRKAFEQMDTNKDGLISRSELMKVLFEHHFYMHDEELAVLLNRLGFGNKNHLSYLHFLSAFEDPRYSKIQPISPIPRSSLSSKVSYQSYEGISPEEAIVKLRRSVSQNAEAIRNAFGAFDQSGSGRISTDDLHRIIDSFCFKISHKQFKHLLSKISVQADNTVDYGSFMESFQKTDNEASKKWLENVLQGVRGTSPNSSLKSSPRGFENIDEQISAMVKAKDKKLLKAFSGLDANQTGTVEPGAFRQVLDEHTLKMPDNHFEDFCNKFDSSGNGNVDYKEFLKHYTAAEPQNGSNTSQDLQPPIADINKAIPPKRSLTPVLNLKQSPQAMHLVDVEELIKPQILNHWKGFSKACRSIDQSNTGEICSTKFKAALESQGIVLSDEEFAPISDKYDTNGTGKINYLDFMKRYLVQSKDQSREATVLNQFETDNVFLNALITRMRREIRDDWKAMWRVFKAGDRLGTGTCSAPEMKQTLRRFKIAVNEEELFHLMTYFDKDMTGLIHYNELLKALLT